MTLKASDDRSPVTVDQAMTRVLQAERDAAQAVEACRRDAVEIRQAAQQRAARIASRTNERLAVCHMRCNSKVSREILEQERLVAGRCDAPGLRLDEASVAAAVESLARTLTGAGRAKNRSGQR
jgi:hypothetical protein